MAEKITNSFYCSRCGNLAAHVGLEILLTDGITHGRLVLKRFIGEWSFGIKTEDLKAVGKAISKLDSKKLYEMDLEYAPFHCPTCKKVYCNQCWEFFDYFDGGFFDKTNGTCPNGHTRMTYD